MILKAILYLYLATVVWFFICVLPIAREAYDVYFELYKKEYRVNIEIPEYKRIMIILGCAFVLTLVCGLAPCLNIIILFNLIETKQDFINKVAKSAEDKLKESD